MKHDNAVLPQLILKADDYGNMIEANSGINELIMRGLLTDVSIMITLAGEKERDDLLNAIEQSPSKETIGIVLHVNFQTGRPLCDPEQIPSLVNGSVFKRLQPIQKEWETYATQINPDDAERELDAQINKFYAVFRRYPHALDSHNIILSIPPIDKIAMKKAKELGIPITYPYLYPAEYGAGPFPSPVLHTDLQQEYKRRDIPTADHTYSTYFHTYSDPVGAMLDALKKLQPGVTQIVFHPIHSRYAGNPTEDNFRFQARVTDYLILTNSNVAREIENLRKSGRLTSYKTIAVSHD